MRCFSSSSLYPARALDLLRQRQLLNECTKSVRHPLPFRHLLKSLNMKVCRLRETRGRILGLRGVRSYRRQPAHREPGRSDDDASLPASWLPAVSSGRCLTTVPKLMSSSYIYTSLLFQVGGATGIIGDPSGRRTEREPLSLQALEHNVAGIQATLNKIFQNASSLLPKPQSSPPLLKYVPYT